MSPRQPSPEERAVQALFDTPGFANWFAMVRATGGCAHPVRLKGHRTVYDVETGEIYHSYDTARSSTGYLLTACGNRRASRCPACSRVYQGDTFHLISAGLSGGKGIAESVRTHPRLFATFTAPSFGAVHGHRQHRVCRARREKPDCPHGRPLWCTQRHSESDERIGQPLCAECYDYEGAVLWNAHAGKLWQHFTLQLPKALACLRGISRAQLRREVRVSFAKVAEYQARGMVHFHAVIRADGAEGSDAPPPAWLTTPLLERAIREAIGAVTVNATRSDGSPLALRWGHQLDIRAISARGEASPEQVAAYVAKYATKGAESAGTVDRRIRRASDIDRLEISAHARGMIRTCFALSRSARYRELRLHAWAHMLGYRGHFTTKSRRYSTTLTRLRQARTEHAARSHTADPDISGRPTAVEGHWVYLGSGLAPGEHLWADVARRARERDRTERAALRQDVRQHRKPASDHQVDRFSGHETDDRSWCTVDG